MNEQKIFNVATYKRDEQLIRTLQSIERQADVINVMLNSHANIPRGSYRVDHSKINWYLTDNSIGDGYKFYKLNESDGYFFTIDDDLVYPPHYADYMINKYHEYNSKRIVTLHGRSFDLYPIKSYYYSASTYKACLGSVIADTEVQVGGTGVMMFHTDLVKFPIEYIKYANMADIWIAKYAKENNIKITVLAHDSNFLEYQDSVGSDTIWDKHHLDDYLQTTLINEILSNEIKPRVF